MSEWIPVKEDGLLPDDMQDVVITTDDGRVMFAIYVSIGTCDRKWFYTPDGIIDATAWMPLPEPYREEETT